VAHKYHDQATRLEMLRIAAVPRLSKSTVDLPAVSDHSVAWRAPENAPTFDKEPSPMIRIGKWQLILIAVPLASIFFGNQAWGKTITATSCSVSDVQSAINASSNGDTVVIPNGSCSWSSGIVISKQITLQGQSVGGVTITDMAGSADLMAFTIGNSFRTTIANLRFMPGNGTGNYVTVSGQGLPPLMHDMDFKLPNFQLQHAVTWMVTGGVIWNTTFESTTTGNSIGGSDSGCLLVKSYLSWDAPSTMGTLDTTGTNNLYIEDSTFNAVGQCPDVDDSGRVVIRHSQIIGSSGLTHGLGAHSGRSVELYNNSYTYPNSKRALGRYFWFRGGTAVVTNNDIQWINGPSYPDKLSFCFIVEGARWNAGGHGCCTGWMCHNQVGSGASATVQSTLLISASQSPLDVYQISDPVYIWNNRGTGQGSSHYGTNDVDPAQDNCHKINPATGQEFSTTDFYKAGRDYFYDDSSNPNSGAKPGWAPYTYPHPLRQGSGVSGTPPAAPTNLGATVQ
jgi:hypothetical protein